MKGRTRTRAPRDSSRRRIGAYIAIGLFLLVDVILVAAALTANRAGPESVPAAAASSSPLGSELSTASATPEPTVVAAAVSPVPATRILSAVSSTVAWRAVTGVCPAPLAEPEVSTDAGVTWTTTDANGPTDITALQSIAPTNGSVARFVGFAAADCSAQVVRTFVGGDNYASVAGAADTTWYVDPVDRAAVHGPDGAEAAPCDAVVALAAGSSADSAAVLCADTRVFATTDAAATWSAPLTVPGALTLTATTDGYLALAAGAEAATADASTCLGLNVIDLSSDPASDTGDLTATTTGCYATDEAPAALAGNVAVSAADGTLWLWIGDTTVRSTDAGRTWQ
jgi:hypothetical protein